MRGCAFEKGRPVEGTHKGEKSDPTPLQKKGESQYKKHPPCVQAQLAPKWSPRKHEGKKTKPVVTEGKQHLV